MSTPKRTRSRENAEKLTAEFTTGQVVVASVVAILFAVSCFLAGIVAGRLDPSLNSPEPGDSAAVETAEPGGSEGNPPPGGVQVSPRTDLDQRPVVASLRTGPRGDQPITEIKPLPAPGQSAAQPATQSASVAPGEPVHVSKTDVLLAEPPPPPMPTAMPEQPVETTTPAPEAAPPITPPAVIPAAERGTWGIQLAAFFGEDQGKRAEEYQRRLKDNASLSAEIIKDSAKNCHQICLVGYKDRAAAMEACTDLRKRPQFKEAFPRELPAQ